MRLDGAVTDVEVNSTLVEDGEGPAIQVIVRDIADRKRREAVLRESEERLMLAFAGAQEGVWDWNLETRRSRLFAAVEADARLPGRRDLSRM